MKTNYFYNVYINGINKHRFRSFVQVQNKLEYLERENGYDWVYDHVKVDSVRHGVAIKCPINYILDNE